MPFLVDDILLAPVKLPAWIAKEISEAGYKEMTDEGSLRHELLQLQMRYELGEVDTEEYELREAKLFEDIDRARTLKKEAPADFNL